jgi:thiol-disulfide isomerase/thioredoxin
MKDHLPVTTNRAIRNSTVSQVFKEYLIAQDIKYWLRYYGITHATDSIFGNFKNEFEDSEYRPTLEKDYNAWLKIFPGSPAPDFNGTTSDGKPFRLSQLKGKIVYIDMWATWCAPCVAEIPHSIKLQEQFEGNSDIEFLNVSNDTNLTLWKEKLISDKDWKGMHIVQSPEQIKLTWKDYRIAGLPAYILIDKSGNIVDANAARPSNGKIKEQIDSLLNL